MRGRPPLVKKLGAAPTVYVLLMAVCTFPQPGEPGVLLAEMVGARRRGRRNVRAMAERERGAMVEIGLRCGREERRLMRSG